MIAYDGVQGFERGVAAFDEQTVQLEPRRDPNGLPRTEIRFEEVDFHYPGSDRAVLDGLDLVLPAGTLHGHRRPQRRRQDDAGQAPGPAVRADRRPAARRRHRHSIVRRRRLAAPDRGHLPGLQPLRADGGREHRLRRHRARRRPRADPRGGPAGPACWPRSSGCPPGLDTPLARQYEDGTSCPAASGSASPSRGPSSPSRTAPRSWSSTSRRRRWTSAPRPPSSTSSWT